MVDPKLVIKSLEKKFNGMTYEEREDYLNKMGFDFGTPTPEETLIKKREQLVYNIKQRYNNLTKENKTIIISEIFDFFDFYDVIKNGDVIRANQILECVVPELDIEKTLLLCKNDNAKQVEYLQNIDNVIKKCK